MVTARLRVLSRGQRRAGGGRVTRSIFISVISVYTPTARGVKLKFMEDKVPMSDVLLIQMLVLAAVMIDMHCGEGSVGGMALGLVMRQERGYWSSVILTK